ncbi:MAG: hypothetical protein IJ859_02950, partial [Synergistaceae bacterium]|nr:hypothetical protein [Synergistaceae bacterium]MBR2207744.1 hypothetical protein [Synergistaceae bacterium]
MAKEVTLVKGDEYKTGYVGFSWATFFFGFICPAIRKDWKWMFIMWGVLYIFPYMLTSLIFALLKAVGAINPYDLGTVIILPIVLTILFYYIMVIWMAFIYNKAYTKKFIAQDFRLVNDASAYLLQNAKITVNDTVANNDVTASS